MKSYLKSVEEIIGGEYRRGEIYSIFAEAGIGKTLFLIGEALNMINEGGRVVWIDSEGGFMQFFEKWRDVYIQRFGWKYKEENFYYRNLVSFADIMKYLGIDAKVDLAKEGKLAVIYKGEVKKKDIETVYTDLGRVKNTLLIVDSFSEIFRGEFGTTLSNFSGRADGMGMMFYALRKIAVKLGAVIILSHHESRNPSNPYLKHGDLRGGSLVKYMSKYILYFDKPRKNALSDFRRIWGVRTPVAKMWEIQKWVKITANGYEDSSEEEIQKIVGG